MQLAGSPSWRINEDRWPEAFEWALWFRAAERIDVASAGVVPGPADVEPLPDPSTDPSDAAELTAGWLAWWHSLVELPPLSPPFDRSHPPAGLAFSPPGFPGLAGWPALQRAVTGRWREAHDWHTARMRAGHQAGADRDMRTGRVVAELERELGRQARPFSLDFVLLPVRDDQVRAIGPDRYLIPEPLHDGPRWPELLRALLIPRA
jgi:hypothetical protein